MKYIIYILLSFSLLLPTYTPCSPKAASICCSCLVRHCFCQGLCEECEKRRIAEERWRNIQQGAATAAKVGKALLDGARVVNEVAGMRNNLVPVAKYLSDKLKRQ